MPAVTLRTLRPDMAAELNRLETQAAVLERDARNVRAILVERGLDLSPADSADYDWEAAYGRLLGTTVSTWRTCIGAVDRLARKVSPYFALGFRLARRGVFEAAVYCAVAGGSLAAIALTILVLAPPE